MTFKEPLPTWYCLPTNIALLCLKNSEIFAHYCKQYTAYIVLDLKVEQKTIKMEQVLLKQ